jgi:hypothetical protein
MQFKKRKFFFGFSGERGTNLSLQKQQSQEEEKKGASAVVRLAALRRDPSNS